MAKIVLAHGILGFNTLPIWRVGLYFNGVARLYRSLGHEVLAPNVAPLGNLDQRSAQLASAIAAAWPGEDPFTIVAHSLGGLDARRVIARHPGVGRRVKSLITISTPHFGSPVADAVLDLTHPLRPFVPDWIVQTLQLNKSVLQDLRTRTTLQDEVGDAVKCTEIACDCTGRGSSSPLFRLSSQIGKLPAHGNDGLVTVDSASVPGRKPKLIWELDHGEAIGWSSAYLGLAAVWAAVSTPRDHLERYKQLLSFI